MDKIKAHQGQDKKIIFGLIGQLAAGKGTVVNYLKEKYHASSFRYSDPLRKTLEIFDLEISRDNMQTLSTVLRHNFGENLLAQAILKQAKDANAEIVAIDGIRRFTDIENFSRLKNFHLVYIATDQKTRYQRYISRNENIGDETMTFEDFEKKDQAEADRQVPAVAKQAEFTIDNNGTLEELYRQIKDILKKTRAE